MLNISNNQKSIELLIGNKRIEFDKQKKPFSINNKNTPFNNSDDKLLKNTIVKLLTNNIWQRNHNFTSDSLQNSIKTLYEKSSDNDKTQLLLHLNINIADESSLNKKATILNINFNGAPIIKIKLNDKFICNNQILISDSKVKNKYNLRLPTPVKDLINKTELYNGNIANIAYQNGIFSGEVKHGIPDNGNITNMTYRNGIFSGKIKDGIPDSGNVTNMAYENGIFSGKIKDRSLYNGNITNMTYRNGIFSGEVKHGSLYNGNITNMTYQNGIFSGKIKDGSPNGDITNMTYRNGIFSGKIKDGIPDNGNITNMTYKNGIFSGKIKDGIPDNGNITNMTYKNGIFSGEVKHGIPDNGNITNMMYKNGIFSGEVKDGNPYNGNITNIAYENGIFSGEVKHGIPDNGNITNMMYKNGIFSGEVKHGIPDNGDITNMTYKNGIFSGEIKDGNPYNGNITNMTYKNSIFSGKIKHGALSNGMSKFQTKNFITPFQKILRSDNKTEQDKKFLLFGDRTENINTDITTQNKYDINNDNSRRYFESIFGKNMLDSVTSNNFDRLNRLTNSLLNIAKNIVDKPFKDNWVLACNNKYNGKDSTLRQLSINIVKFKDAMPGTEKQKELLIKMYKLHYLSYYVEKSKNFTNKFKDGIFSIYGSHSLYQKRGRLDDGKFRQVESHHLGILRSTDKAPYDMQLAHANKTNPNDSLNTRCPDRFEMEDPNYGNNKDNDSWLSSNFNKLVSPVVNGMSGSMLVEIRFITFCREYIKENNIPNFLYHNKTTNDYFKIIAGLFLYFEGGHSFNEIISPFELEEVKQYPINRALDMSPNAVFYKNNPAVDKSINDTELFDSVLQNKKAINELILQGAGKNNLHKIFDPRVIQDNPEKKITRF